MRRRYVLPVVAGAVVGVVLQLLAGDVRIEWSVAPSLLVASTGVLTGSVLLVRDRARRAAGARLATAVSAVEQSQRRFLSRLDHELKNPLTALLAALPEDGVARGQADRITRLLTDLRRVADIETAPLDFAPLDLPQLLQEAVELAVADDGGGTGRDHPVHVDVPSAPWPLPAVFGDADLLLVALYNLIANALKHTNSGDVVEVRARESDFAVVIEVADTGPGIGEDEHQLVWEELARGRSAIGRPGSGVGLALVRTIADRHGGTVSLRSRLGAGTSFQLSLPAGARVDRGVGDRAR